MNWVHFKVKLQKLRLINMEAQLYDKPINDINTRVAWMEVIIDLMPNWTKH